MVDLDAAWCDVRWVPPLASPAQHLPGDHNYMCIGSAHCTRAARQRRPLTNENKNGRKIFSASRNLLNELRKKATSCVGAKWKMLSLWSAREICLCALQPASLLPSEQTSGGAQFIGNFLWRSPFFTANYASWSDTYNGQRAHQIDAPSSIAFAASYDTDPLAQITLWSAIICPVQLLFLSACESDDPKRKLSTRGWNVSYKLAPLDYSPLAVNRTNYNF